MKIEKTDIGNDKTEIKMILFSQGSGYQEKAMVDLELGSTSIVLHEAQQLLNDGHRTIILDMHYVDYIDAEGIWTLQEIYRKADAVNGSFSVINLRNQPKEVLGFTRLLTKLCNSK